MVISSVFTHEKYSNMVMFHGYVHVYQEGVCEIPKSASVPSPTCWARDTSPLLSTLLMAYWAQQPAKNMEQTQNPKMERNTK